MATADLPDRVRDALGDAYTIERELGGGGMSRVFVADERALGRRVVVKVLPPDVADGLSAARFKREVRVAARLQHPHIVPLLAAGELADGVLYYTMPFVEGENLRARLAREGALPVADAVAVACDVAGALAYAHRAGVVHRDVKPENVLLADGGAVVADFGIAKAISAARGEDDPADDARRSTTLTAAGTSLGTPAYMAPEQAVGDAVDHRADLYALGIVLYEMLTGRPPFEGRGLRQLLAAHATETPEPVERRRPSVSAPLAALVARLLEKQPADRPRSADEVLRALQALGATTQDGVPAHAGRDTRRTTAAVGVAAPRRAALAAAVAALLALGVAIGIAVDHARSPAGVAAPRGRPVVAFVPAPPGQELRPEAGFALSPDGARLAFVALDERGTSAIWLRALDSTVATRVEESDGASGPFWSPDGQRLGYFVGGRIMIADLRARTRRPLCPASRAGGATWTERGDIVYSPDPLGARLHRARADRQDGTPGQCAPLTTLRPGDFSHRRPSAVAGGRYVLFSVARRDGVLAADVGTGAVTVVRPTGTDAQFASPDWIVFRDDDASRLYAQRVDLATLRPIGEPRALLGDVSGSPAFSSVSATQRAIVVMQQGDARSWLLWVNRQSVAVDSAEVPAPYRAPFSLGVMHNASHDGKRILVGGMGLWLYDRSRRVTTRLRAETERGQGIRDPVWSPGDSLAAYTTVFRGSVSLRVYRFATAASDSLWSAGRRALRTPDWSPDGRRIAFQVAAGQEVPRDEIWIWSADDRRAVRAWEPEGNVATPRWSPDGRWLAYVSDESGSSEVYLRPMDAPGAAVRVSTAGGEVPRWRPDGRELFYRAPDGAIMSVAVRLGATLALSAPRTAIANPPFSRRDRGFDVDTDGERLIAFGRGAPPAFTIVVDWEGEGPR